MNKVLGVIFFLAASLVVWYFVFIKQDKTGSGPKAERLAVSKNSAAFNLSAGKMLDAYFGLTESMVTWDTTVINTKATALKQTIDSLDFGDLKKDTTSPVYQTAAAAWGNAKAEADALFKETSLEEKKQSLNLLSQQLFDLLRTIRYDQQKLYYEECPMAFDNGGNPAGAWIGKTSPRRNPYLGTAHPKYGAKMLDCGETKDSVNYIETDATLK
jgi:hypothetical protein